MTNVEGATSSVLLANVTNQVTIPIGRAFAKVNVEYDKSNLSHNTPGGELDKVKYMVRQNPVTMNLMPVYVGTQLQSSYWLETAHSGSDASKFFNNGTFPADLKAANGAEANMSYAMENSNKVPRYGNVTTVLLEGEFKPTTVHDPSGTVDASWTAGSDFWRVRFEPATPTASHPVKYTDMFYSSQPSTSQLNTIATAAGYQTGEAVPYKYEDAKCYYNVPLAHLDRTSIPETYTVERNKFFYITVDYVTECGSNTPDIPNPEEPIENVMTKVVCHIKVLDWDVVDQKQPI